MPTPEEEQVHSHLTMLIEMQWKGMNNADRRAFEEALEGVKADYETAVVNAKNKKYYKDLADSIAKNLPLLVRATQSAMTAFDKGDYISGSAALVDIAASIVPVLANLSSVGGPEGVLLGAFLSLIGQILGFFAPKQPSLESKIQKMLDHMQSETEIKTIRAIGHSISSYSATLRAKSMGVHTWEPPVALAGTVSLTPDSPLVTGAGTNFSQLDAVGQWLTFDADTAGMPYKVERIGDDGHVTLATPYRGGPVTASTLKLSRTTTVERSITQILEMPLTSQAQADDFLVEIEGLKLALRWNQGKLDAPVFANWQVAGYLEREANRTKDGWPEVLALWCEVYLNLLSANAMLTCLADPKTLEARIAETREPLPDEGGRLPDVSRTNCHNALLNLPLPDEGGRLPDVSRTNCHTALLNLKAMLKTLHRSWDSDRTEMLKIVRNLIPVARERGLYVHLGFGPGGLVLHVAQGSGKASQLSWGDYKHNVGTINSISIHAPGGQKDSLKPKYVVLTCGQFSNLSARSVLDSVTGNLSDGMIVIRGASDGDLGNVFGRRPLTPGVDANKKLVDVSAFAFNEGAPGVTLVAAALRYAREWYLNYYTLNQDGEATLARKPVEIGPTTSIRSLYVPTAPLPGDPDADGLLGGHRPAPNTVLTYAGAEDSTDLGVLEWTDGAVVKGPEGWLNYVGVEVDANHVWLYGWAGIACATHASVIKCKRGMIERPRWLKVEIEKPLAGDWPNVRALYPCADGTLFVCMHEDIYTADYRIDLQNGRAVSSAWTVRGGVAKQMIKMPIPCWSMLESLSASLLEK